MIDDGDFMKYKRMLYYNLCVQLYNDDKMIIIHMA